MSRVWYCEHVIFSQSTLKSIISFDFNKNVGIIIYILWGGSWGPEGLMVCPDLILVLLILVQCSFHCHPHHTSVAAINQVPLKCMLLGIQERVGILLSFWALDSYVSENGGKNSFFFFFWRRKWLKSEVAVFLFVFFRLLACMSLEGNANNCMRWNLCLVLFASGILFATYPKLGWASLICSCSHLCVHTDKETPGEKRNRKHTKLKF